MNNNRPSNLGQGVFPRAVCSCMDNSEDNLVFAITKRRLIWVNEMGWWIPVHLIMLLFLNEKLGEFVKKIIGLVMVIGTSFVLSGCGGSSFDCEELKQAALTSGNGSTDLDVMLKKITFETIKSDCGLDMNNPPKDSEATTDDYECIAEVQEALKLEVKECMG